MTIFKLRPVSLPSGDFAPTWFDDEELLWNDERLHKPQPLLATWQVPTLRLLKPNPTPVLFNPNAFAVSDAVRLSLAHFPEIEFLPIGVTGFGTFFVMHVTRALPLPDGSSVRRSPVSKNIVELFAFPKDLPRLPISFEWRSPTTQRLAFLGSVCVPSSRVRQGRARYSSPPKDTWKLSAWTIASFNDVPIRVLGGPLSLVGSRSPAPLAPPSRFASRPSGVRSLPREPAARVGGQQLSASVRPVPLTRPPAIKERPLPRCPL